jgi:hypothetical protein
MSGQDGSIAVRLKATGQHQNNASVRRMVPTVQRVVRLLNVFGSDQQLGSADGWIHSTGIVGPDHRLNPGCIQNTFRYLGIRR